MAEAVSLGSVPGKQGFSASLPTLSSLAQVLQQDRRSGWSRAAGAHSGVSGLTAEPICQADHPPLLTGSQLSRYPLWTDVGDRDTNDNGTPAGLPGKTLIALTMSLTMRPSFEVLLVQGDSLAGSRNSLSDHV